MAGKGTKYDTFDGSDCTMSKTFILSFSVMKCPSFTNMTKIQWAYVNYRPTAKIHGWLNSWKIFYFFAVQNVMRNAEQKIFFYNMHFAITQM